MAATQPSNSQTEAPWYDAELPLWTEADRAIQFPRLAEQLRRGTPATMILDECRKSGHTPTSILI